MKRGNTATRISRGARGVLITPLVSSLALLALGGCSTNSTHTGVSWKGTQHSSISGKQTAHIDPQGVHGVYTPEWFAQTSREVGMSHSHLSEAQVRISDVEARRAGSQAALVEADAVRAERFASTEARYQQALTDHDAERAHAAMLRESYRAKLEEMISQSEAQERVFESQIRRDQSELGAQSKEWRGELERMRAEAQADFERSLAQHERMLAGRHALETRGEADIQKMLRVIELREARTNAQATSMRATATSVQEASDARVSELEQQIQTERQRTSAIAQGLRDKAGAIRQQAEARALELRAEANAIEIHGDGEGFETRNVTAEARFNTKAAEAEQLRAEAEALAEQTLAEVERRRAESHADLAKAERAYNNALDQLSSVRRTGLAEIEARRSEPDRIEKAAKASFLQAEAQARAVAVRERSEHARALGEKQLEKISAQAEAEAAQIRAKVSREVAKQVQANKITLPLPKLDGEVDYAKYVSSPEVILPSLDKDTIDPQHVVRFKTELARAALMRLDMDMTEADLFATLETELVQAEADWLKAQSEAEAREAGIDALRRRGEAHVNSTFAEAERIFDEGRAEFEAAKVDAKSVRRESVAQVIGLRAEADSIETRGAAAASHLLAQAQATEQSGETRTASLSVKRDAELMRGQARARQVLADAKAFETAEEAAIALMHEQVQTTERIMQSELARLDQAAASFQTIAKATFDEASAEADAFQTIAQAHQDEWTASNDALRRMAEADLNFMRELTGSNRLLAQAAVERELADTEARYGIDVAYDILARAEIDRDARIASASIAEQFTIADAEELAAKSWFDSRVVATQANRNRDFAADYLEQQQTRLRTQQALASAAAFEEMSASALARLDDAVKSFQRTEQPAWNSRLAQPSPFPTPSTVAEVNEKLDQGLVQPAQIANVPTND